MKTRNRIRLNTILYGRPESSTLGSETRPSRSMTTCWFNPVGNFGSTSASGLGFLPLPMFQYHVHVGHPVVGFAGLSHEQHMSTLRYSTSEILA